MHAILMERPEAEAARYLSDHPTPEPGRGEVRVRVARTAICGTDRHIWHWDESIRAEMAPPVVIGHEFCGHIDALGDGVESWSVGDYVSAEMHIVCGRCRACAARNFHVCERTRIAGLGRDGSFAEQLVVPAGNLVQLDPEVVPPEIGSFLDALGNAVHTVQAAERIEGRHVLVSGYGAIGAMAAAVAEFLKPASLTITEVQDGHLGRAGHWAESRGNGVPIHILNPFAGDRDDMIASIREATDGGPDVALEMSGAGSAINDCLEALYPGGVLVHLGIPAVNDLTLHDFSPRVIFKGLTLKGVVGRRMFETWEEMLDLLARGLDVSHIVTHRLPLGSFEEGIRLLDAGDAHKVVLDPTAT